MGIQALLNQYQQKYPLYTMDNIVELMLDDGVITFDIAKKIKSGASLFIIDNELLWQKQSNDFSMSEIMGGYFTPKKSQPKTNFNRKIEPTFQPMTQGDCWLLSDINALNQTEWGRKAIEEAIIPDTDGSGGVTIKFKGSPLKQKEIHITADEIEQARNSGNYVKEDDDVIAFELATEKTFREMVKQGIAKRNIDDDELKRCGSNYRSYIYAGVATKDFQQYPFSKLLGIQSTELNLFLINGRSSDNPQKEKDRILKFISTQSNISAWCSFYEGIENKYVHGNHAYSIKSLKYMKEAVLIDPHYSDKEIEVPWEDFIDLIVHVLISEKGANIKTKLEQYLPSYYEGEKEDYNKRFNPFYK